MRLTFQLRFRTAPGQSLWLTGAHEIFGGGKPERARPLQYLNQQSWGASFVIPEESLPEAALAYEYLLKNPDGSMNNDWGKERRLNLAQFCTEHLLVIDSWNDASFFENSFYTEPFQQVLLRPKRTVFSVPAPARITHTFRVRAPLLDKGQTLCLLGEGAALGQWNTERPLLLSRTESEPFLSIALELKAIPIIYKYGVYDVERARFIRHEAGENRFLQDALLPGKQTLVDDGFARLPSATWKGAGVAIPVFSLRSERSFGVGEFADLKPLADWCQKAGLKLIQVLPVNDTTATHTWTDSYPYSAISAFALHPIYLNLEQVANGRSIHLLKSLEPERQRLNALAVVDYVAVVKAKLAFLRTVFRSQKERTLRTTEYQKFFEQNRHWLVPYAAFSHLRDKFATADFNVWPEYRRYEPEAIAALAVNDAAAADDMAFSYFVQYHLDRQLRAARHCAQERGVVLKGDIAIGVYRYGVDAWQHPELYHMDVQAGAPPDAFAAKGQNWGFPTYDWPRMKADGFTWWKRRFAQMSQHFDAFRLDHILGFFRIWSIPCHAVEGILGYFVPALAVQLAEFAARGIRFDRERFLEPYITEAVLSEIFGAEGETVKARFLEPSGPGQYRLQPQFGTQRQVEGFFASQEANEANRRLREGLYDLISNVLLFEVEGSKGQDFHVRLALEQTTSFKHLDAETRGQLWDLCIDYFFRRQDGFWKQQGMEKLPALRRVTNMLVCGEDLGMVPDCVPEVMRELGLLSLEVQRMPKRLQQEFSRPREAPYLSVVTPSTHDMSTLRGWWREEPAHTQKFYNQELGLSGDAPAECEPALNQLIVLQHLSSPAMWSIFQLQDLLGMDAELRRPNPDEERINVPANPKHYWRYRMHLTLEKLLVAEAFNEELKKMVDGSGRGLSGERAG